MLGLFFGLEVAGYLLHYLSGAFLRTLVSVDAIATLASEIGYLTFAVAIIGSIYVLRANRSRVSGIRLGCAGQGGDHHVTLENREISDSLETWAEALH